MDRSRSILFAASVTLFTTSIAISQQTSEKKAEEVYKNIQSFKNVPAKDILPSMQYMSQALGQDCEFCHVSQQDRASDAKPEKNTARKMIAMTKAINAANFNGRDEVTCVSCHNGHSSPTRVLSLGGARPNLGGGGPNAVSAAKLLDDYERAIGGSSALANLKTVRLTGTQSGQPNQSGIEVVQASPQKFLITGGGLQMGYNGSHTWVKAGAAVYVLEGVERYGVLRQGRFFRGADTMLAYSDTRTGTETLDGKRVNVLRGTVSADKVIEKLYFDSETHLLVRAAYFTPTILGYMSDVFDFSGYHEVSGVKIPMKIVQLTSEGEGRVVRTFTKAEPNVPIDASKFDVPKAGG
jgi:photosynthetic reaction center cytochrome c subunit